MFSFNNMQHISAFRPNWFKPGDMLYNIADDQMDIVKVAKREHSLWIVYTAREMTYAFQDYEYIGKDYMVFRKLFPDMPVSA